MEQRRSALQTIFSFFMGLMVVAFFGIGLDTFYPYPDSGVGYGNWEVVTSIALIVAATAVMTVSLLLADRLLVLSDGLLLGGLFTMVYGIGRTFSGENAKIRFVAVAIALLVTMVLGYIRFVWKKKPALPAQPAPASPTTGDAS